jgi:outer membrane immunogenic protein
LEIEKMAVNKKEAAAGLASAVALISGAQVANAADADLGPAGFDWSGFYLGLSAGMQWGDAPFNLDSDYDMGGDIAFGGFAGVNHQYGDFVVGAELAAQTGNETDGEGNSNDYDVKYTVDGKLKLGMVLGAEDQLLVYGFGGIFGSGTEFEYSGEDYSAVGVNYGVGAEYMITEQFSLGAEFIARTPLDDYGWSGNSTSDSSYQASLRGAFHF